MRKILERNKKMRTCGHLSSEITSLAGLLLPVQGLSTTTSKRRFYKKSNLMIREEIEKKKRNIDLPLEKAISSHQERLLRKTIKTFNKNKMKNNSKTKGFK